MEATKLEFVNELISSLTAEELIILKDTIRHGFWGDTAEDFLAADGSVETAMCYGYITNDAKNGGHFKGRKISSLFRSIVPKLAPKKGRFHSLGRVFSHAHDWWGDGSGDVLFIRTGYYQLFEEWAAL